MCLYIIVLFNQFVKFKFNDKLFYNTMKNNFERKRPITMSPKNNMRFLQNLKFKLL